MAMDINPNAGPVYQIQGDNVSPPKPIEAIDPRFEVPVNPDGAEAGPLYLSSEAERWVQQNVTDPGYVIDWGTREIIDPNTGEVKGTVPSTFDRMM